MDVRELRVGALIYRCNEIIVCNAEYILECESYHDKFKPIPLTEEWLLRLGFKPDGFANYKVYYNIHMECAFSFGNYARANGEEKPKINIRGTEIFFERVPKVHQLQNIYFALTGEELTLKEPE